jgi:hypothetical protein
MGAIRTYITIGIAVDKIKVEQGGPKGIQHGFPGSETRISAYRAF